MFKGAWFGLLLSSVTLQANLVSNGSFEQPNAGGFYRAFLAGETVGAWIVESGSVEVVGTYWQAAQGSQSLDLSGIFEMAGTLYQDVPTVPGQKYKVRFAFAGNPEDQAIKDAKVFWNDNELAHLSVNTAGRSLTDMGWIYYEYEVTAAGTSSRLKFQSLTLNFLGPVIDDVSVTSLGPVSPQTLANGSFENPPVGGSYVPFLTGANIDGWIVESGTVEVVGTYWQAAAGTQSLDLSGIGEEAGTIYQDVATVPGQTYKLRFAFAGNPEDQAIKEAKVFWNDNELAKLTVNTAGRSLADMGWTYYSYDVMATGTVSRVKFQSLTLNFLGPVIDDVSLGSQVPATITADLVIRIRVTGTPGDRYRIEYSQRMNKPEWMELETVTIPPSGQTLIFDTDGVLGRQRTYRAVLLSN
ncbi:MAG TPA: choice-of-anchor C family protein [Verrucomicrobiae bacterium]